MKISENKTIKSLKDEFQKRYPGLKMEFFKSPHDNHQGSTNRDMYSDEILIKEIYNLNKQSEFTIEDKMKVSELEAGLKQLFDLNVQVYRKSKDIWLQTTSTDDWTLETQNQKGLNSMKKQQD